MVVGLGATQLKMCFGPFNSVRADQFAVQARLEKSTGCWSFVVKLSDVVGSA